MAAKIPADVEQLAKSKGIELAEKTSAVSKGKCTDCKSPLLEGTGVWYEEQIMYFEEPMIKYWIVWSKELRPAAYSWPMGERKYRCHKCFNDFNDARTKMTATREQATKAASKKGIKLFTDGPYFPGRERRRCKKCSVPLTNKGWYSSGDTSKNNKQVYVCWDVMGGTLVPLAYKVAGEIEVYVCHDCFKKNGRMV